MNGSPAISFENRVQRWHNTHRSRSSRICVETRIGLGNVRFFSWNRLVGAPLLIAWFCSGHSPPLSQIGQSRGWLMSRNSIIPACAFAATGEVNWVRTTMPGVTSSVQLACGFGIARKDPSGPGVATSTRHCRHAPAGASSGWSQNRGIAMPICSAARMISVPLGTPTSTSSMVTVTRSGRAGSRGAGGLAGAAVDELVEEVIRRGLRRRGWRRQGRRDTRPR